MRTMGTNPQRRHFSPFALPTAVFAAAGLTASIALLGGSVPIAVPGTIVSVEEGDISNVRPLTTAGWWYDIGGTSWDFAVTKDGPDNDPALKITTSSSSDKVYLYNVFAPEDRPTDIPALVDDASYTYAGANVNFQLEVIFEPVDVAAYGPAGSV